MKIDRRSMIKATMSLAAASLLPAPLGCGQSAPPARGTAGPPRPSSSFLELVRPPARVELLTRGGTQALIPSSPGHWQSNDVEVRTVVDGDLLRVSVTAPRTALERIVLRWDARVIG